MKLIVAIVQDKDAVKLSTEFVKENIRVTKLASTGGFLKTGNTTFMIGTEEQDIEKVLTIIENNCANRKETLTQSTSPLAGMQVPIPVSVEVGGATVFIVDVNQFHQF